MPRITALTTGQDLCACACADGSVRLFVSPSLELLTSIGSGGALGVHPNSVALGPGNLLSVVYSDGGLASWSLRDPRAPKYLQLPAAAPSPGRASFVGASRALGSSPSAGVAPETAGRSMPQRLSFGSISTCPPALAAAPAAGAAAAVECAAAAVPAATRPPNSLEKGEEGGWGHFTESLARPLARRPRVEALWLGTWEASPAAGFAELEQLAARFRALRPHSPVRASPSLASLLRLGSAGAGGQPDTAGAAPLDTGSDACLEDPLQELDAARAGALVHTGDEAMVPEGEEQEGARAQAPPRRPLSASQPAQQPLLHAGSPLAKPLGGSSISDGDGQAGTTAVSDVAASELPGSAAQRALSPPCCLDSPAANIGALTGATPAAWGGLFSEPRDAAVAQALSLPSRLASISPPEKHAAAELPSRDAFSVFSR